jgi:hypothetical protein
MPKTFPAEPDASSGESTGTFRIIRTFVPDSVPTKVSSHGRVVAGPDAQSYIPVVRDATPKDVVAVVISMKTPQEQFMEWANNWLQDEQQPIVESD